MRIKYPVLGSLALAATLAVPVIITTAPSLGAQVGIQVRIYDRHHKDYHAWDDHEDRLYRSYLAERRREYIEYNRLKRGDQDRYWRWRHEHWEEHERDRDRR